ncbi:MAG: NAD(P)/FAD-dependent oxidoreductase [Sphingomonadaceae bacterium]|nr:NAD(P)/FAD-dependent oxidoreductase [Sphingomonadaceae bacterium]
MTDQVKLSPDSAKDRPAERETFDVVIVGAGFGGLAALHKFRDELGYSVRLIEAASGAGGVWYWNGYPGARCDVESLQYALAFSPELTQEWSWTERFSAQPEILAYVNHVVERFDMARDMRLDTRVTSASYDETSANWIIKTDRGDQYDARYVIMATGPLSTPYMPAWPGLDDFKGEIHHTGLWPHEPVDLSDKRVAIVGTGSSGVQAATAVSQEAEHLFVFQRTPHHIVPATNRPLDGDEQNAVKARYPELYANWTSSPAGMSWRSLPTDDPVVTGDKSALEVGDEERQATFERAWNYGGTTLHRSFNDLLIDERASQYANEFIAGKIATLVKDPETAALLVPTQYYGTKRLILETGYYEIFNQPNVTLVDAKSDPIECLTAKGIRTGSTDYDVDVIIFATGYDALTGSLNRIDIRGRDGMTLADAWRDGPQSHLGIMVSGFPNIFLISGPQSPSALANVIVANEQQVNWVSDAVRYLDDHDIPAMEPETEAQAKWVEEVNARGMASIYTKGANWYWGANINGKSPSFLCFINFADYKAACDEIASTHYSGFVLADAKQSA